MNEQTNAGSCPVCKHCEHYGSRCCEGGGLCVCFIVMGSNEGSKMGIKEFLEPHSVDEESKKVWDEIEAENDSEVNPDCQGLHVMPSQVEELHKRIAELEKEAYLRQKISVKNNMKIAEQARFIDKLINYVRAWATFSNGEPEAKKLCAEYEALQLAEEMDKK